MSYTIIQDPQRVQLDLENDINRVVRHCRIGRVEWKPIPIPKPPIWSGPYRPWWEDPFAPTWSQPGTGYVNPLTTWTC